MNDELEAAFCRCCTTKLRLDVTGADATTFAIGGPLRRFVEPNDRSELMAILKFLGSSGESYRILGSGSNLLISDHGVDEWIIRLGRGFRTLKLKRGAVFEVGASYSLMTLARTLTDDGYAGLEFAGGIPATLGGAVRMNAGAHGGEMSDVLRSVTYLSRGAELETVSARDLRFAYRHSELPAGALVVSAELELVADSRARTSARRAQYLAERKSRQPLSQPSAGSVFRNPSPEQSAGRLIEACGLKGRAEGGATISAMHGNWIVNEKRTARQSDVLKLIELCRLEVQQRFELQLEPEVIRWP